MNRMVYCVKCGEKNPDDAQVCTKCGAQMYTTGRSEHYRRVENECFGIPRGGTIFAAIIGLIIVIVGVNLFLQTLYPDMPSIPWWPMVIVAFGVLLIIGAIYGLRRRY